VKHTGTAGSLFGVISRISHSSTIAAVFTAIEAGGKTEVDIARKPKRVILITDQNV